MYKYVRHSLNEVVLGFGRTTASPQFRRSEALRGPQFGQGTTIISVPPPLHLFRQPDRLP